MGSPTGKYEAGIYSLFRLTDWNGGLNTSASPNSIADNEMVECENLTVSTQGVLRRRAGLRRVNAEELQAVAVVDFGSFNQTGSNTQGHLRTQP